eukprot:PITA_35647
MISLATQMGWEIHQMDVKTTFLNEVIEEEVYIKQPEGFETHEKKSHVCRLKKALYGLKQALRAWYGRIDGCLQKMGFVKSDTNPNLYYLVVENEPLILVLYVDDLFPTRSSRLIKDYKKDLATKFDMKDLGQMHYFLGLEVWQQKGEIFPGQGRYATKTLKRFRIQLIGSLMYLVNTRSDICYTVNTLRQFMVEPKRVHWATTKHVLRLGWKFSRSEKYNWVCFNIGLGMTWCSRKQKSVALSSAEAEYMAASRASYEAIWLRKLLVNLFKRMEATRIMCDNQSCIKLSENPVFHDRSKHIDISSDSAMGNMMQQVERALQYKSSSGSGSVMGSSGGDVRQQAKHQHRYRCGRSV